METLELLARRLAIHTPLSTSAIDAMCAVTHSIQTVGAGKIVAREAEPARDCCVLLSGFAVRHKIVSGGKRQILSIDLAGDVLNLDALFAGSCDYNVQTVSACVIARIDRDALSDLLSRKKTILRALALELARQAAVFREWMANVGSRDARTRAAHLLCEIGFRLEQAQAGSRFEYELPMTQEQLADATGLSLIHISRTLKALETDGIIRRERRSIHVLDWERMKSEGDFNPLYLSLGENGRSDHTT